MSSLSLALSSATSSLQAIQTELAVASNNVANADTDGYTVKSATKVSTVTGSVGSGVLITSITSSVDANLLKSIVAATSAYAEASTTEDYLDQLSDIMGQLSSDDEGSTLASSLTELQSTLEELAATPESESLKTQAVLQLTDVAASLRDISSQVQDLRAQADSDIATAVDSINETLYAISDLNDAIVEAQARGDSTADLEDQRNQLVTELAEQINISYYVDDSGAMTIYTGGQALLNSSVHELSYTASGTVTSETVYPTGFDAITVNGVDITESISSGTLASLVELRDETLVEIQDQLDTIATDLKDELNEISNSGSSLPAPQTLTGTVDGLDASDSFSGTGTLTLMLTDEDGELSSSLDIDLSGLSTVQDVLDALNSLTGISASLDSDGQLVITSTDSSLGVSVSGGEVNGESFSSYFGLNDLLTGDGAEDLFVRSDITSDPSLLQVATTDDEGLTLNAGALAQAMADVIDSSGATTLVSDVGSLLTAATSTATSKETTLTALTDSFSSQYGVNIDEETARITELENAYAASAQILSVVQEMFDALLNAVS